MKKILVLICTILCLCVLAACNEVPQVESYKLNENGNLIATFDDGTTQDLGTLEDTIANGVNKIEIDENDCFVINGIATDIKADVIKEIETVTISDDGYYVLNGVKTNIVATEVFEVSFDTGYSATLPKKNVKDGYKVELPELTRTGYTLDGWYCNGEKWSFNANVVKNDMTLTAVWVANSYSLSFDSNGGSSVENLTIKMDEQLTLPTPTYPLYTFDGWYNGNTKIENGKFTFATDLELTAKWHRTQYNIAFNTDGGNAITTIKVDSFSQVDTLPTPERNEYEFLGWYLEDTKIELPYAFTEGNITLKAHWRGVTQDYDFTEDDAGTGIKIAKYKGNKTEVVIPTTLGGKIVTTIGTGAFDNNQITCISFNCNIQNFEYKAFQNCTALEKIDIAGNTAATLIYMFGGEDAIPSTLKEINFVDGTSTYGKNIFDKLSSSRTFVVHIYSSLKTTPADAFYECNNISELYFPEGITTISSRTTCAMANLTYVNIPSTVTSIGMNTFINLPKLKYLIIPASVKYVDYAGIAATDSIIFVESTTRPTTWGGSVFSIYEDEINIFYGFEQIKENENFKYALCKVGSVTQCVILENKSNSTIPEMIDGYVVATLK